MTKLQFDSELKLLINILQPYFQPKVIKVLNSDNTSCLLDINNEISREKFELPWYDLKILNQFENIDLITNPNILEKTNHIIITLHEQTLINHPFYLQKVISEFERLNFICVDLFRQSIWNIDDVAINIKQSALLFINSNIMNKLIIYPHHFFKNSHSINITYHPTLISRIKQHVPELQGLINKNNVHLYEKYKNYTMIPKKIFLDNLSLVEKYSQPKGAIVECGVWKGGMSAALAEIVSASSKQYLFDSFEGLPKAKEIDGEKALEWQKDNFSEKYYDNCSADQSYANEAMAKSGKKNYSIIKGWFSDTLKTFDKNEEISVLRMDGDWYDSTIEILQELFDCVITDGLIIIDDYFTWEGCSKAVHDFLSEHNRPETIQTYGDVAFIRKLKK